MKKTEIVFFAIGGIAVGMLLSHVYYRVYLPSVVMDKAIPKAAISSKVEVLPTVEPTLLPSPIPTDTPSPQQQELAFDPFRGYFSQRQKPSIALPLDKTYTRSSTFSPFASEDPLFELTATGNIHFSDPYGLVRILVRDTQQREYLVFESYPLLAGGDVLSLNQSCEETCALPGVRPVSIEVEVHNASLSLSSLTMVQDPLLQEQLPADLSSLTRDLKSQQITQRVSILNRYIEESAMVDWQAGETSLAWYSHTEKKQMFTTLDELPNLQGLEYYVGGTFVIEGGAVAGSPSLTQDHRYPEQFDWRNRHGTNWMTPAQNQETCGSCWAFSALSVAESLINIYHNNQLNISLSEQQVICGHPGSCLNGNFLSYSFESLMNEGVVPEYCMPHTGTEECNTLCAEADTQRWKIEGFGEVKTDTFSLMDAVISKGPITLGVYSWSHFLTLVGYEILPDNQVVWIVKNSWGSYWGENGYARLVIPPSERYGAVSAERPYFADNPNLYPVRCTDADGDGYCSWGLADEPPDTCASTCKKQPDWDDTNALIHHYSYQ